jgi:Fe2+ or Zn2+ uptake regulation protein
MNNLNVVIQAIIFKAEAPISGYDITKMIKDKTGNSHQQVYRELNKLAKRNDYLVEDIPQDGKPDKKMYSSINSDHVFGGFVTESGSVGDYSKTKLAYELLIRDILDGTNNYDGYIKTMREAETKFLKDIGER